MKPKKKFPLAQVLSITTGRLLCDVGGVYEILNHCTGDNLFTHVLPRASRFAEPLILRDIPELGKAASHLPYLDTLIKQSKDPMKGCKSWLKWLQKNCGLAAEYEIPSYADSWLSMNPLDEPILAGKKVIAIEPP